MGETTTAQGDVKTSATVEGQTPGSTTTFTKEQQVQVDALVAKAKSDTKTDIGRLEAELKRSQSVTQGALSRLKQIDEERVRAEEEAIRDDPAKLSAFRMKQDALRIKAEAEDERKIAEAVRAEAQTHLQEALQDRAERLAEKYNVDASVLLQYGGTNRASMENLAKSYGERTAEAGDKSKQTSQTTRMTNAPDKGRTSGGGGGLTKTDVTKMSPEEQHQRASEIAKLSF